MGCSVKLATIILSTTVVLLVTLVGAQEEVKQFQWISPDEAKQNLSQLIPAGLDENDRIVYVARLDGWLPGKSVLNDGIFYGYFSYKGQEYQVGDFEILVIPIGTTSWVPAYAQDRISKNAVVSGVDPHSEEKLYICRAWQDEGKLMVGRLEPYSGLCFIPYHGEATMAWYEVLEINAYGQAVGLSNSQEHHTDSLNKPQ